MIPSIGSAHRSEIVQQIITHLHEYPQLFGKGRVAAAVVYKGEIVGLGVNQDKTHPLQRRYSQSPLTSYLHAEFAAYLKAGKVISERDMRKADLYVIRLVWDSFRTQRSLAISKPCPTCQTLIKDVRFRRVFFSDETGQIQQI